MQSIERLFLALSQTVRSLGRRPGSTALTILTLAMGIGIATAVFSVVEAVLLKPLPYQDADRVVMAWGINPEKGIDLERQRQSAGSMGIPELQDWQEHSGVFERLVAFNSFLSTISDTDDPEGVFGYGSTPGLFQMLGVEPMLGRGFLPEEEQPGGGRAMVLMHHFWLRRFRGDPSVIGTQIDTQGFRATIVGVMPPDFVFFNRQVDLLLPYPIAKEWLAHPRDRRNWRVMGRLEDGLTLEEAQARADVFSARLAQQHPDANQGWRVQLVPVSEESAGRLWPAMRALFGALCCLLLVVCLNIANLRLVQASVRSRELALRTALGAARWRLLGQMLTESLALGAAGAALGIGLAWTLVSYFQTLLPGRYMFGKYMLQAEAMEMGPWVIGFAVASAVVSALSFGLIGAWRATKPNLVESLKDSGSGSAGGLRGRAMRDALVMGQVAIAVILVTGAGLLVRSFAKLYEQGAGIQADDTLMLYTALPFADIREQVAERQLQGDEAQDLFQSAFRARRERMLEEVAALPEVEAVALGWAPVDAFYFLGDFHIEGRIAEFGDSPPKAVPQGATAEYFSLLGIPLQAGRLFDERDHFRAPRVAIVNQELVRRYFAGQDPIGQHIGRGSPANASNPDAQYTIIGVVGDVRLGGMDKPPDPILYTSMLQSSPFRMYLFARTRGEPMAAMPRIRAAIQGAVPGASADRPTTLATLVRESVYEVHYSMLLLSGLGVLALLLAAVGVYGVLSFSVGERTREIGVRMSLGAQREQVLGLVVRQGVKVAAVGVVLGLAGAATLTRYLSTLLFGVETLDLVTFAGVAAVLVAVAALASYVPARRAAAVDPMQALRHD